MFDINIQYKIALPIEVVFEAISDHQSYNRFKACKFANLVETGDSERNGLNALREVHVGPLQLMERITVFERPTRMDYHIESSKPVYIKHTLGSIKLTAVDAEHTHVSWESQGFIQMPLIGWLIDKRFSQLGAKGFLSILKHIEREAAL
ncbi:SRPBCC family protein [Glaciecola sp.]|nr:SRPBCC family protein [Glaciecola sp.]